MTPEGVWASARKGGAVNRSWFWPMIFAAVVLSSLASALTALAFETRFLRRRSGTGRLRLMILLWPVASGYSTCSPVTTHSIPVTFRARRCRSVSGSGDHRAPCSGGATIVVCASVLSPDCALRYCRVAVGFTPTRT